LFVNALRDARLGADALFQRRLQPDRLAVLLEEILVSEFLMAIADIPRT
jgi:hypothetical protein